MTEKVTTVSLSSKYDKTLNKLAEKANTSKKDYIEKAILFFDKQGINPLEYESPKDEMTKLTKRIDQVIAFIRAQERNILKPACETIIKNESKISSQFIYVLDVLEDFATNRRVKGEIGDLYVLIRDQINDEAQRSSERMSALKDTLLLIASSVDEKNKQGLSTRIKDLFS